MNQQSFIYKLSISETWAMFLNPIEEPWSRFDTENIEFVLYRVIQMESISASLGSVSVKISEVPWSNTHF
jgi:hypothetical protein